MKLTFDEVAWAQYLAWVDEDRKVVALIGECLRDPFRGTGKPPASKAEPGGLVVTAEHRLMYRVRGSGEAQAMLSWRYPC